MINYLNGFIIVSKSWADAGPHQDICRIGNKEYRGMERAYLEDDLVADYYAKKLPPEIYRIMASENKESNEWPFFNYNDERSYNGFHKNGADIYRMEVFGGTGTSKQIWPLLVAPMGPLAKNELPEVVDQVRLTDIDMAFHYKIEEEFVHEKMVIVDPSFFSMFDFPLVEGNASQLFADVHSNTGRNYYVAIRKVLKKMQGWKGGKAMVIRERPGVRADIL